MQHTVAVDISIRLDRNQYFQIYEQILDGLCSIDNVRCLCISMIRVKRNHEVVRILMPLLMSISITLRQSERSLLRPKAELSHCRHHRHKLHPFGLTSSSLAHKGKFSNMRNRDWLPFKVSFNLYFIILLFLWHSQNFHIIFSLHFTKKTNLTLFFFICIINKINYMWSYFTSQVYEFFFVWVHQLFFKTNMRFSRRRNKKDDNQKLIIQQLLIIKMLQKHTIFRSWLPWFIFKNFLTCLIKND